MSKLKDKVERLYREDKTGLSFFLTGGYPDMESFTKLVKYIDKNNLADFIEVGIPFSDPVADGPVIQESSQKAISAGTTYNNILMAVKSLKNKIDIPLVLMSYLNILLADELEKTLLTAADAGFSAAIIPDMPYGEHEKALEILKRVGMELILLISPGTPDKRVREIGKESSPFLYYVSSYGVTGNGKKFDKKTLESIRKVRNLSAKPVYCGFGITTGKDAQYIADIADGEIIGSAVIDLISENNIEQTFNDIYKFAINIGKSIRE